MLYHYQTLQISSNATEKEIQEAFQRLSSKHDKSSKEHKEILEAFEVLSNPIKRREYDASNHSKQKTTTRPRYKGKNDFYYTKGTKMWGTIFVLVLILLSITLPIALSYYSSKNAYEEGNALLYSKQYTEAMGRYDDAIKLMGARSALACIQNAQISMFTFNNFYDGQNYIDLGFNYAEDDIQIGILHYLQGIVHKQNRNFNDALNSLDQAEILYYHSDSIAYHKGSIFAFNSDRYEEGMGAFRQLIKNEVKLQESYFGLGWCQQNLGNNSNAVNAFDHSLQHGNSATVHYYKAIGHIDLQEDSLACGHLNASMNLGSETARRLYFQNCINKKDSTDRYRFYQ